MNLERIPTSSCLVRIDFSSIDAKGNFVSIHSPNPKEAASAYARLPVYGDAAYNNSYFTSTQ